MPARSPNDLRRYHIFADPDDPPSSGEIYDFPVYYLPSSGDISITQRCQEAQKIVRLAGQSDAQPSGALWNEELPVNILGCGAAGAAAARYVLENEGTVRMVDTKRAFLLQLRCETRWISPTIYRWPDRAHDGTFGRLPFPWYENYSSVVAKGWRKVFRMMLGRYPKRRLRYNVHAVHGKIIEVARACLRAGTRESKLALKDALREALEEGFKDHIGPRNGMCLICFPLRERTDHPEYQGPKFWSSDSIETFPYEGKRAVIVGSGDGAMQDALRIMVGADLRVVVKALRREAPRFLSALESDAHRILFDYKKAKEAKEAEAARAAKKPDLALLNSNLSSSLASRVRYHYQQYKPLVDKALGPLIKLDRLPTKLTLISLEGHGIGYALNIVLLQCLSEVNLGLVEITKAALKQIECDGVPSGKPGTFGDRATISLKETSVPEPADALILRLGVSIK